MKGVVILGAILIVLLIGGFYVKFVQEPQKEDADRTHASESGRIKATITVAGDNYSGYDPLKSQEFSKRLRSRGYAITFVNDGGNYTERHLKFQSGEYDFMVLPVSTYISHGGPLPYQGRIPVALSESRGADNILAYKDKLVGQENRLPTVNDLNNPNLRFCFTEDSPSSFLLQVATVHFDLWNLKTKGSWLISTDGSHDAYERLKKGECDVAILWEPDVSAGLDIPGVVSVFGSDEIDGMIIDVFVAGKHLFDDRELMDAFFLSYFETLQYFADNKEDLIKEMLKNPEFKSKEAVEKVLGRIEWFDLHDNCGTWYDIDTQGFEQVSVKQERIIDTIVQVEGIMVKSGQFTDPPLQGNPYRIVNFDLLRGLCGQADSLNASIGVATQTSKTFDPLTDEKWARLRVKGKMKIDPITFAQGTAKLTREGKATIEEVANALVLNYPRDRILVKGHTSPSRARTDEAELANKALSQERADVVENYLKTIYDIDENRMKSIGLGSDEPLDKFVYINDQGQRVVEGNLSWLGRLPRVEFVLLRD